MNASKNSISERMEEAKRVCARNNPIYGEMSNFSLALYVLGLVDAPDIMSVPNIDMWAASEVLNTHFIKIEATDIPSDYRIAGSADRYLLVLGDPLYPVHFAALVDNASDAPFFSKLRYFGSGFDSLNELYKDFFTERTADFHESHYFRAV